MSYGPEAWYNSIHMEYFGKASDEGMEALLADAAISQMKAMGAQGRVHTIWTMMTPFIGAICNCRPEDCLALLTHSRTGVETMERAEYVARVDETLCTGCGLCDSMCHFKAVNSHQHHGETRVHIDPHKCFGCGLCRLVCSAGAVLLVVRKDE